jgi:acetyltransferase
LSNYLWVIFVKDKGGSKFHNSEGIKWFYRTYQAIEANVSAQVGGEHFLGVSIQPMLEIDRGYELIIGSNYDDQCGPVIIFGTGGRLVDIFQDYATALPPLNTNLARRLLEKTKIYRAFNGTNGLKSLNLANLEQIKPIIATL